MSTSFLHEKQEAGSKRRPEYFFSLEYWRKDPALNSCSLLARGLWIEMMAIMHECEPYGHLITHGKPIPTKRLARMVGESEETIQALLEELEEVGVFSRTAEGCIFSSKMFARWLLAQLKKNNNGVEQK